MKRLIALAMALGAFALVAPSMARADADDTIVVRPIIERPVIVAVEPPFIGEHEVRGTVSYFNAFSMTVRADGRQVPVHLHQGTIINPRGLTLIPGMYIRVFGFWANGNFQADRIGLIR